MVTVEQLKEKIGLKELTQCYDGSRAVSDGCSCDLLSWVMAKGQADMAWVTVQTHLNVIAVACLHDFSCIIIPENIEVAQATIKKAEEEDMMIFSSEKTAYEICCAMGELGIGK